MLKSVSPWKVRNNSNINMPDTRVIGITHNGDFYHCITPSRLHWEESVTVRRINSFLHTIISDGWRWTTLIIGKSIEPSLIKALNPHNVAFAGFVQCKIDCPSGTTHDCRK